MSNRPRKPLVWVIPKGVRIRVDGRDDWGIICEDEVKHWVGADDEPETPCVPNWWMGVTPPEPQRGSN